MTRAWYKLLAHRASMHLLSLAITKDALITKLQGTLQTVVVVSFVGKYKWLPMFQRVLQERMEEERMPYLLRAERRSRVGHDAHEQSPCGG
jgi:hypothetical protein